MKNEPVLSVAAITAGVTAVIALLVAFGLPITDAQSTAILGVVAVVAPFAVAYVRKHVTPNGAVVEREKDGVILAGEANELPTDTEIRDAGTLAETE